MKTPILEEPVNVTPLQGLTFQRYFIIIYLDLIIFEERLRQNLHNLQRLRKRLYYRFTRHFSRFCQGEYCRIAGLVLALSVIIGLQTRGFIYIQRSWPNWIRTGLMLVVYGILVFLASSLFFAFRAWRLSLASRYKICAIMNSHSLVSYKQQCQKMLKIYNLQLNLEKDNENIGLIRRIPRRLSEFIEEYRSEYRARRALRPSQPAVGPKKQPRLR